MTLDENPKPPRGKRGEYLAGLQLVLFFAFVLMPAWSPPATSTLLEDTYSVRWAALVILGSAAIAIGVLGFIRIRPYLTPLPYPVDHNRLVQDGVYALIRHPLYSCQLIAALGYVLFSLSIPHLALLILGFLFFDFKASKEERWLAARHPEYSDYARRVRKLVPGIY